MKWFVRRVSQGATMYYSQLEKPVAGLSRTWVVGEMYYGEKATKIGFDTALEAAELVVSIANSQLYISGSDKLEILREEVQ